MNWKKRTQKEVDKAVKAKDYTGGYEYLPWLIYMRLGYLFPILGMFIGGLFVSIQNEYPASFWTGIVFIAMSIGAKLMLIRDYRALKKGISH